MARRSQLRATRGRLVLAALLLGSLAVGLVLPTPRASAAAVDVEWFSPDGTTSIGGLVTVDADARFELSALYKVKRWRLQLLQAGEVVEQLCSETLGSEVTEADVSFLWDTYYHVDGTCSGGAAPAGEAPLANGQYTLRLTIWEQITGSDGVSGSDSLDVAIDNDPAMPLGVSASFDAAAQVMTTSWSASDEPDLTGYQVQQCRTGSEAEACDESAWTTVSTPDDTATTTQLSLTETGTYRYRVAAQRAGASGTDVNTSPWSDPSEPVTLAPDSTCEGCDADDDDETGTGDGDPTGGSRGGAGGGDGTSSEGTGDDGTGGTDDVAADPDGTGEATGGVADEGERHRSLPPRLIQQTSAEPGYSEALPYGARTLPGEGKGPLDLMTDGGAGLALVPVASGLLMLVFAFQMRYLSKRAALAVEGPPLERPPGDPDDGRGAGAGSFITGWRRWLAPPEGFQG